MYLHIGNGKSIRKKDIVGVFDLDSSTVSKTGKRILNKNQREGKVIYEDFDLPRSFVLESKEKNSRLHLSRISVQGLKSRLYGNNEE